MANTVQIKSGAKASLPTLNAREFGFATDTYELFIGKGASNLEVLTKNYVIDEDDMASNSVVKVPTQQSVKAYTDAATGGKRWLRWMEGGGAGTGGVGTGQMTGSEIKVAYEGESDTNAFTDADHSKLDAIEASADVTDATNVNSAGAVMEADYDANTILAATSNDTPVTLTVAEQRIVGRITSGNIAALTATQVRTLLGEVTGTFGTYLVPQTSGSIYLSTYYTMSYRKTSWGVDIAGFLQVSSVSSPVGPLYLTNLPYTTSISANKGAALSIYAYGLAALATTTLMVRIIPNTTNLIIVKYAAGGTGNLAGDIQAGSSFYIAGHYPV